MGALDRATMVSLRRRSASVIGQVIGGRGEGERPAHPLATAQAGSGVPGDDLDPADGFLDPLPCPLAERVAPVNGRKVPGSDQTIGFFSIGAGSILTRRVFLSAFFGIGLTEAAPDYTIGLSLPIQLDLPVRF